MIRITLAILVALSFSGCASMDNGVEAVQQVFGSDQAYGYKSYDPCIRCGEGWIFLPNPGYDAQREDWNKRNQKFLTKEQ